VLSGSEIVDPSFPRASAVRIVDREYQHLRL
jgi:hypothetical protein